MKVGLVLLILHDVIEKLVGVGLLTPEGDFVAPTLAQDLNIARIVEESAKARGVVVNDDVDKIILALPFIVGLIPGLNK